MYFSFVWLKISRFSYKVVIRWESSMKSKIKKRTERVFLTIDYVVSGVVRDKKGWTQRVGLANVSPKGLYHGIRGWFKLDSGS